MATYPWLSLSEIKKYEPEMERLGVSKVARSPRGFLTWYKRDSTSQGRRTIKGLADFVRWRNRRRGFIARHLVQYRKNPTYRRWLALVAWAYRPDRRFG